MEQIGACTLYCGDAAEIVSTLAPVDSVITDPPYGVELRGKMGSRRLGNGQRKGTRRPDTFAHEDTVAYFENVVLPILTQCRNLATCMAVISGVRNLGRYPSADDIGCFFFAAGTGCSRWGFTCMSPILYYGKDPYLAIGQGSRPNACAQTSGNDANLHAHPCAKPIRMMRWLVNRASLPGQVVLDPFMGSGTTGYAALQLQRGFIGIEINPAYFEYACRRLEVLTQQLHLFPVPLPSSKPKQGSLYA